MTETGGTGGKNFLTDAIGVLSVDVTVVAAGAAPLVDLADLVCIWWRDIHLC